MATITTTIKEPKTFQEIQTEQNQLGKEKSFEDLNNNIAKLIQTINRKSEKELTADEKQIKANQLELSKLQLRRAQLGLANDQKTYSSHSQTYSKSHSVSSSVNVDQNTRDNTTAIALSAATGGMLNPVIIKQVLLPPLKFMTNAVSGIVKSLSPERRISGKSSSAIDSHENKKLHNKLDQIIKSIKDKTYGSGEKGKKSESFFSKALGFISGLAGTIGKLLIDGLKGVVGAYLAIKLGEKLGPWIKDVLTAKIGESATGKLVSTLKAYGPLMAAGLAIAGWKGALVALGLQMGAKAFGLIEQDSESEPTIIDDALGTINSVLQPHLGIQLKKDEFQAMAAGAIFGGVKGALLSYAAIKAAKAFKFIRDDKDGDKEKPDNDDKGTLAKKLSAATGIDVTNENMTWTAAGLMFGGIRGAALGLAASIVKETGLFKAITGDKELKTENPANTDKKSFKDYLKNLGLDLTDEQIKAAAAGLMFCGWRGALLGVLLASDSGKKAVKALLKGDVSEAISAVANGIASTVDKLLKDTPLAGIDSKIIMGAIAGATMGMKGGPKAMLIGAILGGAGGFVWSRIRSKQLAENYGIETTITGEIGKTGKTWDDFEKLAKAEMEEKGITGDLEKYTADYIKRNNSGYDLEKKDLDQQIVDVLLTPGGTIGGIAAANLMYKGGKKVVNGIKTAATATTTAVGNASKVIKSGAPYTGVLLKKAGQLGIAYGLAKDSVESAVDLYNNGFDKYDEMATKEARNRSVKENLLSMITNPTKAPYALEAIFYQGIKSTHEFFKEKISNDKNEQIIEENQKEQTEHSKKQNDLTTDLIKETQEEKSILKDIYKALNVQPTIDLSNYSTLETAVDAGLNG